MYHCIIITNAQSSELSMYLFCQAHTNESVRSIRKKVAQKLKLSPDAVQIVTNDKMVRILSFQIVAHDKMVRILTSQIVANDKMVSILTSQTCLYIVLLSREAFD